VRLRAFASVVSVPACALVACAVCLCQVFIKGDAEQLKGAREGICGNTWLHTRVWLGKEVRRQSHAIKIVPQRKHLAQSQPT